MQINKRLVICFIGIDGSGKTSNALAVHKYLASKNINCRYIHHSFSLLDYILPFFKDRVRSYASKLSVKNTPITGSPAKHSPKTKVTAFIFCLFAVINSFVSHIIEASPFFKGVIVYDRYTYDHIMPYINLIPKFWAKVFIKLIGQPSIIFALQVDSKIAFERKREDSLDFYVYQSKLVSGFVSNFTFRNIVKIDANLDQDEIKTQVIKCADKLIKANTNG